MGFESDITARFENRRATGFDDNGLPIPGRFPLVSDSTASGLRSTPKELPAAADECIRAYNGESSFCFCVVTKGLYPRLVAFRTEAVQNLSLVPVIVVFSPSRIQLY